jgi:hypothetical protein
VLTVSLSPAAATRTSALSRVVVAKFTVVRRIMF